MRPSRFDHLAIVQLLQNSDDYNHILTKELYLSSNFTLETYMEWCINRLFSRWPIRFPDLVFVLGKMTEKDPFFKLGSSNNERRFHNLLLHYGKKNKKPSKNVIFYLNSF